MKQKITQGALVGSLLLFLTVVRADDIFIRFIVAGELPGGLTSLSANAMLTLISLCTGLILAVSIIYINEQLDTPNSGLDVVKRSLPTQRYAALNSRQAA